MTPPPYIYASSLDRRDRAWRGPRRRGRWLELAATVLISAAGLTAALAEHLIG
ncbi:MAG TPA: hypothetical protein VGN69_08020 [Solirubrobacteraceae bacterium]|jgi:hypothetical protein|nr:hypothetical protein [Solirubrobacteraceae bacterium]